MTGTLATQYAFNLFSHNAPMTENGYNEEEMKMVKETRKILGTDDIAVTATCIRVPVMRAHAESINLELQRELSEDEARTILASAPGVSLSDDRESNRCAHDYMCFVYGRRLVRITFLHGVSGLTTSSLP